MIFPREEIIDHILREKILFRKETWREQMLFSDQEKQINLFFLLLVAGKMKTGKEEFLIPTPHEYSTSCRPCAMKDSCTSGDQ
jgi:hypothetical protein